jgi:predicted DNA repair protein MutK
MPLMMVGGLFLCFEGVEKLVHKILHKEEAAAHSPVITSPDLSEDELLAVEQEKLLTLVQLQTLLILLEHV